MIVNNFPSSNANTVAPYVPLGRQPVGQENSDLKASSLKALEQSAALTRNENQRIPYDQLNKQAQQQLADDRLSKVKADELKAELQAKEQLAEEQTKAQKAEEAKKNARKEQYQNEQKKELSRQEEEAAYKNTQRIDSFKKANKKAINLNRHLVEIGAIKGSSAIGNLLNHRV